jgi:hypothetical protein
MQSCPSMLERKSSSLASFDEIVAKSCSSNACQSADASMGWVVEDTAKSFAICETFLEPSNCFVEIFYNHSSSLTITRSC